MKIFINRVIACINRKLHKIYFSVCSLLENSYLRMIGVQIRGGNFRGWTSFFVSPKSKIVIGSKASLTAALIRII